MPNKCDIPLNQFCFNSNYSFHCFIPIKVDPNSPTDPEGGRLDTGDGILDLMLKPSLTTYESKEDAKEKGDDDD